MKKKIFILTFSVIAVLLLIQGGKTVKRTIASGKGEIITYNGIKYYRLYELNFDSGLRLSEESIKSGNFGANMNDYLENVFINTMMITGDPYDKHYCYYNFGFKHIECSLDDNTTILVIDDSSISHVYTYFIKEGTKTPSFDYSQIQYITTSSPWKKPDESITDKSDIDTIVNSIKEKSLSVNIFKNNGITDNQYFIYAVYNKPFIELIAKVNDEKIVYVK